MLEALDTKIRAARSFRDVSNPGTMDWIHAAITVDALQHLRKEVFGEYLEPSTMICIKPKSSGSLVDVKNA